MKLVALIFFAAFVSHAGSISGKIDEAEQRLLKIKSLKQKLEIVKSLKGDFEIENKALFQNEDHPNQEVIEFNTPFEPIFTADFGKKATCQKGGVKKEILALYHEGKEPESAKRALRFLEAICK